MRQTILVIDDQWSMQELARIVLQTAGYHVLLAGDGATGLSLARTQHPDLLVLDLHMPGMSGLEVLRCLRQDPHTAAIPTILITTAANQAPAGMCILQKPFHPPALLLMVDNILRQEQIPIAV